MAKTDTPKGVKCSFCGKTQESVRKIIAGPGVYICNECIGLAASMGSVLLACGAKGRRFATPNSEVLIHQPLISGGLSGQTTEIKIHADHMVKTREKLNKFLSERTGQSLEKIEADTERDNFMTAEQALEYGLIDEILDERK